LALLSSSQEAFGYHSPIIIPEDLSLGTKQSQREYILHNFFKLLESVVTIFSYVTEEGNKIPSDYVDPR